MHAPALPSARSSSGSSPAPAVSVRPLTLGSVVVDPPVLQAPMAGYTNFAYRQVVREFGGAGLLATEMIAARSAAWLESERGEHPDRLWGVRDEPRPLAVQMWDNDPENLARVGRRLARDFRVSVVDLNFGCPVRQVTEKAHSGSWLLREPERVGAIVRRVVDACDGTPVTAKIRLGCGPTCQTGIEVAQRVEEAGAACLTVHGRVASQFFQGRADWEAIGEIKRSVSRMPVIGNGDITSVEVAVARLRETGVDGIMVAREALAKPWIFAQIAAVLRGGQPLPDPSLAEQRELVLHHYDLVCQRFGEERGTLLMRKFACSYAQGLPGAREFRAGVSRTLSREEFLQVVRTKFPRA
ncbi:MAG: tRNA-dihydrouridine synthase [Pirellulales bacterium]|nr:tRNA-dihydrouridine synthase [Pirellulales bacterium]MBL7194376.1 tRNA-dihydrouridine synthase [Pirellulales bacterium]